MITYSCKHSGILEEIERQGHTLHRDNGVHVSSDDVAVQAIIDNFDHVAYWQKTKKRELKFEAARRAGTIYAFITDRDETVTDMEAQDAIAFYRFASDLYLSIKPAGREPLSGRLLDFKGVHDAYEAARTDIESLTDVVALENYDVKTAPAWPV